MKYIGTLLLTEQQDESDGGMTEIRFVPDDKAQRDPMFNVMSECQALHPDEDDSGADDDGFEDNGGDEEPGMYDDAEEEAANGAGDHEEQMDAE